jgi:hypothetical protein
MDFGGPYQMISTVVEYEENRRVAWQSRPVAGAARWRRIFGGRIWRYELDPVEGGGTLVRESWDLRQEGKLGMRYLVWGYRRKTRANMQATLDRVEALVS